MKVLDATWADVAQLQNSRRSVYGSSACSKIERRIDLLIDRIASGDALVPGDLQSSRRAIAAADRRDRHQARLTWLHVVVPALAEERLVIDQNHERAFEMRDALRQIITKTAMRDRNMILHLALGHTGPDVACLVGLTQAAFRKRLSRLRQEFAYLRLR